MEIYNQPSYHAPPHSGNEHPSDWIAKPFSIVFIAAGLFILILGIAIFLGCRQFETTRRNVLSADKTTANLLADLLLERSKATMGILQSYAHRPLFIAAVKNKDLAGVHRHLSDLKKNAEIDLTFVTDTRGILWANFPVFPEAIGKDLSSRDWYKGISSHWKPYISKVFKLIVADKPLAAAVCVPILDENERPIGILATSQRLGYLADAIQRVPFSPFTSVNVIDRTGHILYSDKYPYQEKIMAYRSFPIIEPALKEKKQQLEINDPLQNQGKSYLTIVPVGETGWAIVIERSLNDIYRLEFKRFIEIGGISLLLFLVIAFFLVYLRKVSLFRKTAELLQAEIKLRQSEESERETRDYLENLIDYANAPIIVWNSQFRITRFNHAFEALTGLKAEEVLGKEIDLLFPEDRREECLGYIRRTTGGERWEAIEIPILHRYGSVHTVLWNSATIYSPDGKTAIATIAQGQDISDRLRAEEELKNSEKRYRELSIIDDLTQLYNSRHFYHQLKMEIDRAARYEHPLTMLLLDLDSFKAFNDTYGHVEGDRVLARLGQVVKRCLRQTDSAYRYGGEEFTMILPMTTSRDGAVIAERIRTEFKEEKFSPAAGNGDHMTVSVGLGQYDPQEDIKAFVHRVDQLMYQAKKNGKDRVCPES